MKTLKVGGKRSSQACSDAFRTGGSFIFPFSNVHAKTVSIIKTSKKLNTRLPPKTIEWYVHAFSEVMSILVTAIAHGNTQQMLLTRDW